MTNSVSQLLVTNKPKNILSNQGVGIVLGKKIEYPTDTVEKKAVGTVIAVSGNLVAITTPSDIPVIRKREGDQLTIPPLQ
jgi:hypothetical protein